MSSRLSFPRARRRNWWAASRKVSRPGPLNIFLTPRSRSPWIAWAATMGRASRCRPVRHFCSAIRRPSLRPGRPAGCAGRASASARPHRVGHRGRHHGRPGGSGAAQEEGLVDARRDPAGQGWRVPTRAISAGNTGALMAVARYLLKTLEGIDRPAIATATAQQQGRRHHGARPRGQRRLRRRGPAAVRGAGLGAGVGPDRQRIAHASGLLNVGEEAIKGSETIKKASQLLRTAASSQDLNFYGNVEGNDIFKGTTDIVVCDGFVGNVTLKATEAVAASMIVDFLRLRAIRAAPSASLRRSCLIQS